MKYLNLIRWKNLLIIVLMAVFIKFLLLHPIIELSFPTEMMSSQFSILNFIVLVIGVTAISGAGYAINDVKDTKTDRINKPEKALIPYQISENQALNIHHILNGIGVLCGFYLSYFFSNFSLAIFFILPIVLLRFYSSNLSRIFLVGNMVISLLGALLIFTLGFFEVLAFNDRYGEVLYYNNLLTAESNPISLMFLWLTGYAIFSFLMTLIREVIKDIEDIDGDRFIGAQTLPLKLGIKTSKGIVIGLCVITIALLFHFSSSHMTIDNGFHFSFEYASLISAMLIGLIYLCTKAEAKEQYHLMSNYSKILMLVGLGYMIVHFIFFKSPYV